MFLQLKALGPPAVLENSSSFSHEPKCGCTKCVNMSEWRFRSDEGLTPEKSALNS